MVTLSTRRDFRGVQTLPFCYVCGHDFAPGDSTNRDHVPARKVFHVRDREPPLWLPTHRKCNQDHSPVDQKMAQLIGLRRFETPKLRDRQLDIKEVRPGLAAVFNLDIEAVVWRWVCAFHAALYREPVPNVPMKRTLVTPFPRAKSMWPPAIDPLLPQHPAFVHTIKQQRALRNVDRITSNSNKLRYECVWAQFDNNNSWFCIFGLDLYDWKDLGVSGGEPARGCTGAYVLPSGCPPETATRTRVTPIMIPNLDPLDPFAA